MSYLYKNRYLTILVLVLCVLAGIKWQVESFLLSTALCHDLSTTRIYRVPVDSQYIYIRTCGTHPSSNMLNNCRIEFLMPGSKDWIAFRGNKVGGTYYCSVKDTAVLVEEPIEMTLVAIGTDTSYVRLNDYDDYHRVVPHNESDLRGVIVSKVMIEDDSTAVSYYLPTGEQIEIPKSYHKIKIVDSSQTVYLMNDQDSVVYQQKNSPWFDKIEKLMDYEIFY